MRRAVILFLLVSLAALGQEQIQEQVQGGPRRAKADEAARPKPSPEMQKRGYDLLQVAEAGASGLEGGNRAFALQQVARAYEPSDKKKATELLESAFAATRGMDDDKAHTRPTLQASILQEMVQLAPDSVEQHVTEMNAGPWKNQVLTSLLGYYEKSKQLDHAEQMIYSIGAQQEIPYEAVGRVIRALPQDDNGEVQQLFAASLASYRNHQHGQGFMSGGDFPDLILKTWKRVSPKLAHDAIDEVLSQADPANNSDAAKQPFNMTMTSDKGAVAFNSQYQWRLFQLLPALRQLDPGEADDLVKKSREVQTLLDKYPQGMDSLGGQDQDEGDQGDKKDGPQSHGSMSFSFGGGAQQRGGPSPMEMQRAQKISADAEKHPSEALANAQTLSDPRMKVGVLISIARAAAKKDASTARSALDKALETLSQVDEPETEVSTLRSAGDIYLLMGDEDGARKIVDRGLKAADKLYRQDSEGDDPNQALKAYWPSTDAYRGMLRLAAKISPAWATTLLKELPDNDEKVLAQTALAAAWLDVPVGSTTVMTSNKNGTKMMMSDEER